MKMPSSGTIASVFTRDNSAPGLVALFHVRRPELWGIYPQSSKSSYKKKEE